MRTEGNPCAVDAAGWDKSLTGKAVNKSPAFQGALPDARLSSAFEGTATTLALWLWLGGLALSFDLLLRLAHAVLLLGLRLALPTSLRFDLPLTGCGLCLSRALLLGCLFALPGYHRLTLAGLFLLLTLCRNLLFTDACCLSALSFDLLLALALRDDLCFAGG